MTQSIDVILPVLNEAEALPWVLSRMPAGYRPIVVDNGSTDNSAQIAHNLGAVVVRESVAGFGSACYAGLYAATSPIVAFMDCDGSLDPRDLEALVAPIEAERADLVLGARAPERGAWPPHARLANRVLARRIRQLTGLPLRDLGPMRAARRESLVRLDLQDRRSGWPLEMVLRAHQQELRILELRVPYYRRSGRSKVTGTVRGTLTAVRDMQRQIDLWVPR